MEPMSIYMLKVNLAVVVFYLFYRTLFNRDTFFEIRRFCLATILFLSALYPVIDLSGWLDEERQQVLVTYVLSLQDVTITAAAPAVTGEEIAWMLYGVGVLLLFCRMLYRIGSIVWLAVRGSWQLCLNTRVIVPSGDVAPFSFFGWIFINPSNYTFKEMQEIMIHEKAHVRQGHSVDMLLGELACVFLWFNPFVWLLRDSIRQNLEFLADRDVVSSGYNRKNYQYHLLRLSYQPAAADLVNNFNVSQLKKRIIMMNKKKTSRLGLIKYALLLPVTALLIVSGNVEVLARVAKQTTMSQDKKETVVKGVITDENNAPLPGVTVVIAGTMNGVVSNSKGEYRLFAEKGNKLVFSHVGKATFTMIVNTNTADVKLKTEPVEGNEVVVVGYKNKTEEGETFSEVEEMPQFKDGNAAQWISKNIKYPAEAQDKGIQGKVFVSFTINKIGKIVNPGILRGVDPLLDAEALRVIKAMPEWTPAKQHGEAVAVEYCFPVTFALSPTGEALNEQTIMKGTNLKAGANALYIIDGIRTNAEASQKIDPNTIESITVLKDETAVKLYGEEGKNGVIVITTKKK